MPLAAPFSPVPVPPVAPSDSVAPSGLNATEDKIPATVGTLPTHRLQFAGLLIGTILLVSALTYFPVLALGPLAEGLS